MMHACKRRIRFSVTSVPGGSGFSAAFPGVQSELPSAKTHRLQFCAECQFAFGKFFCAAHICIGLLKPVRLRVAAKVSAVCLSLCAFQVPCMSAASFCMSSCSSYRRFSFESLLMPHPLPVNPAVQRREYLLLV